MDDSRITLGWVLMVFSAVFFAGASDLHAETIDTMIRDKKNEIKQLKTRKSEIQLNLNESLSQEKSVVTTLNKLSQNIDSLQEQIVQNSKKQDRSQKILSRQKAEVEFLNEQLNFTEDQVYQEVQHLYRVLKSTPQSFSKSLWPQGVNRDRRLIGRLMVHQLKRAETMAEKRASLNELLGPFNEQKFDQVQLSATAAEQQGLIESKTKEQRQLLTKIQQDRQVYYRYLDELQLSLENALLELDHLEKQEQLEVQFQGSPGLAPLRAQLRPPIQGTLVRRFRRAVGNETGFMGITIETPRRSLVSSITLGKVVFADELEGFQKLVLLDHGKESFSVYGQLSTTAVKSGDFVAKDDVIGTVSPTSKEGIYQLYFEIRFQNRSVDPLLWLQSKELKME